MSAFKRWWEERKQERQRHAISKAICHASVHMPPASIIKTTRDNLRGLDDVTLAAIPVFLDKPGDERRAVAYALNYLVNGNLNKALVLYMRHYDRHVAPNTWEKGDAAAAIWMQVMLVEHYELPQCELPAALESDIVGAIKALDDAGVRAGDWLVECLVKHPDKTERIVELASKRYVATLHDMEALLSDDLPLALNEGAL
jgi:hypothetical protein